MGRPSIARRVAGLTALVATCALAGSALSQPALPKLAPVDVELVLAVDVSRSMDQEEQLIQRKGYADAFRHPAVISAIRNGAAGRIAVTYLEWAANAAQTMPWTLISNEREARAFAATLEAKPVWDARRTSISNALATSAALINTNSYHGVRRVIDISGDGPNNFGAPIESTRDMVVARGIVINGLPIVRNAAQQPTGPGGLEAYYKDCVIGGKGAFLLPVRSITELSATIRAKLVTEIADLSPQVPEEPLFKLAQARKPAPKASAKAPKVNCNAGEGIPIGQYYEPGRGIYEPGIVVQGRRSARPGN